MSTASANLKRILKSLALLIVGVGIGMSVQYFYDGFGTVLDRIPNKDIDEKRKFKNYLNYLESSLDSLHQIKSNPVPGDWLYDHEEKGQTMEDT